MKCFVSASGFSMPSKCNVCRAKFTMCDKAAKIPSDNAMPCCTFSLVELETNQQLQDPKPG